MKAKYEDVVIEKIMVDTRLRKLSEDAVRVLVESMKEIGLINPIMIVRRPAQPVLVAGYHRLQAAKELGWKTIPCMVVPPAEKDKAALLEIDENLIRNELSPAEWSMHADARKEIYERLHSETRHGGDRKSSRQTGDLKKSNATNRFSRETANKAGMSERFVQRAIARAKRIPQIADVVGTSLDKSEELDALGKLSPKRQADLINRAKAGEVVSAKAEVKPARAKARPFGDARFVILLPDDKGGFVLEAITGKGRQVIWQGQDLEDGIQAAEAWVADGFSLLVERSLTREVAFLDLDADKPGASLMMDVKGSA